MHRLFGIFKVAVILSVDFIVIYSMFKNLWIAAIVVGVVFLYTLFGGYIALFKEGAISSRNLPIHQKNKFESAKLRLVTDVKSANNINISGIKLYLIPDDDINATAYGFNCISVTRGTLDNTDPITLNAVLAHEVSHILNFDAEFNRAVFCSVTLVVALLSILSFAIATIIFLISIVFGCFRSCLGVTAYRCAKKATRNIFNVLQRIIILTYRSLLSLISRYAEYRSDKFSFTLGYGVQLSHFLSLIESCEQQPLTLTEILYRSHPPTSKRIAHLEKLLNIEYVNRIANR